jgi:predicted ATPase
MILRAVKITNFKSFRGATRIELSSGFNIIVGKNNAGKTAFLEALRPELALKPHASIVSRPTRVIGLESSRVEKTFEIDKAELLALTGGAGRQVAVHVDSGYSGDANARVAALFARNPFVFTVASDTREGEFAVSTPFATPPPPRPGQPAEFTVARLSEEGSWRHVNDQNNDPGPELVLWQYLWSILKRQTYVFSAERLNLAMSSVGETTTLNANASNLASALDVLSGTRQRTFARVVAALRRVLPAIQDISIRPSSGGHQQEIRVWPHAPETEREDLTHSLADCGTGVGQVLAIVYVVLTATEPCIVAIDEPTSFLHPGAVRELMRVLREHPEHQYIITTHSPAVIEVARPETLHVLRLEDYETKVSSSQRLDLQRQRVVLAELGASLADVFGADQILWVEGPTEKRVFETLLEEPALGLATVRVAVRPVPDTGRITAKDAKAAEEFARLLAEMMRAPVAPAAVTVFLDRENQQRVEAMERLNTPTNQERGLKFSFTKRRMLENYLLVPEALAAVITSLATQYQCALKRSADADGVTAWLDACRQGVLYEEWLVSVDAGGLLGEMWEAFIGPAVVYDKVKYGLMLVQEVLRLKPLEMEPLVDELRTVLRV